MEVNKFLPNNGEFCVRFAELTSLFILNRIKLLNLMSLTDYLSYIALSTLIFLHHFYQAAVAIKISN